MNLKLKGLLYRQQRQQAEMSAMRQESVGRCRQLRHRSCAWKGLGWQRDTRYAQPDTDAVS